MSVLEIGQLKIELNDNGYMLHPEEWDEDIAVELAKMNSIVPLTDDHWAIVRAVREYYLKFLSGN